MFITEAWIELAEDEYVYKEFNMVPEIVKSAN